ncbi:hypothetical protein HDU67_007424 [Dinochytrium kinnereticum]|nr:hypothetical protein HDU67_007424 [Dinochytrium kinnereticum]
MPLFTQNADCYYSQILDCGIHRIPGFHIYGQALAVSAWLTVLLGTISVLVSVFLRRSKRLASPSSSFSFLLFNQFEWFLLTYTVSGVLGSMALTLSAFFNVSSTVFYGLMGPRNVLVYIAITIYVDMVLTANTYRDAFLANLRKIYLRILLFPILIVFGLFIYQGILSDLVHYGNATIPPNDPDTLTLFARVQFINTLLWLLCFFVLTVFVIIARMSFSRYLRNVVEPELQRERERGSGVGGSSSNNTISSPSRASVAPVSRKPSTKQSPPPITTATTGTTSSSATATTTKRSHPRSSTRDLHSTLKAAIWTMKWIALVLTIFLIYSIFFAMVVVYIGEPNPVYYATLAINWWSPTAFGSGIFLIVLGQRWRSFREAIWGDRWEEDVEEEGDGRVALRSLGGVEEAEVAWSEYYKESSTIRDASTYAGEGRRVEVEPSVSLQGYASQPQQVYSPLSPRHSPPTSSDPSSSLHPSTPSQLNLSEPTSPQQSYLGSPRNTPYATPRPNLPQPIDTAYMQQQSYTAHAYPASPTLDVSPRVKQTSYQQRW